MTKSNVLIKATTILIFLYFCLACSNNKAQLAISKSTLEKKVIIKGVRYTAWDDFTVLDVETNLLWEVKSLTNRQQMLYWFYAEQYCDNLFHGGKNTWYLPTISELKTLITLDKSLNNGFINSEYFPQNISSDYWSSTEGSGHGGWYVNFDTAADSVYNDSEKKHARCVTLNSKYLPN